MPVMRNVKGPEPNPPSSLSVPSVSRRSSKKVACLALWTSTLVIGTLVLASGLRRSQGGPGPPAPCLR
jgi:hypothetical protein